MSIEMVDTPRIARSVHGRREIDPAPAFEDGMVAWLRQHYPAAAVRDLYGRFAVGDGDLEVPALRQGPLRCDGQLLPGAAVGRRLAVDGDLPDLQSHEVEVEGREVLGRGRLDGRGAGEDVGRGVVAQVQVVVGDVVPAVAVQWVVGRAASKS